MYSWKDRLIDWANQRGAWTHFLVAVGAALVITAIILAAAMPSKSAVNANADCIGELQSTLGIVVDALGTKASKTGLQELTDALGIQAGDISLLGNRVRNTETRLNTVEGDLAELTCTPPEAHLTGTFGEYTLHIKSSEAGNFTADVHLIYSPPLWIDGGNTTVEEILAGFTTSSGWVTPTVSYNGTVWAVTGVGFNIGTFELAADTETTIPVTCTGLNSTWEPTFAYVEVHRECEMSQSVA